jgi:hypothetical protein
MTRTEILQYVHNFVGFGHANAGLWFVGLEQGGGSGLAELQLRLNAWAGAWPYGELAPNLPELRTRSSYMQAFWPHRIGIIRNAIRRSRPAVVVFAGMSRHAIQAWGEISGTDFVTNAGGWRDAWAGGTHFVVVRHPTAYGITNEYLEAVGRGIAAG